MKLPASVLLGKIDSLAALTGISAATMSSKIHADLQMKTGDPHATESLLYGIPLGMMTLLNIPFKVPASIKSPDDVKKWATSILADFGVGEFQEQGSKFVVHKYKDPKGEEKNPSQP